MAKKKKTASKSKVKSKIGIDPLSWIDDDDEPMAPVFKDAEFVGESHKDAAQTLIDEGLIKAAEDDGCTETLSDQADQVQELETETVMPLESQAVKPDEQRHELSTGADSPAVPELCQAGAGYPEVQTQLSVAVEALVQEQEPEPEIEQELEMTDKALTNTKSRSLVLETSQDISNVPELKQKLENALQGGEVSIDAQSVERVDTASLQLLYAFYRELESQDRSLRISSSDAFKKSAELLGMKELAAA